MQDIHITDLESFVGCRRRWHWSSLLRRGLQKAAISPPLFTGTCMHRGLDSYYKNDRELSAGLTEISRWVKKRTAMIVKHTGALWDTERETIKTAYQLMMGMMLHYDMWAQRVDRNLEFVSTETKYTVPILNPDDPTTSTGLQLVGRFDGIVRHKLTGRAYVIEFKTAKNLRNIDWIYRSIQGTAYTWAAQQLYPNVEGIMYRLLRKRAPSSPKPLVRGGYSKAAKQQTSYEYFTFCLDWIVEKAFNTEGSDLLPADIPMDLEQSKVFFRQQYRKVLYELQERGNEFFMERILRKQKHQFDNLEMALYYVGSEMANPNVPIFPQPSWFSCSRCDFKDPCNLMNAGGDHEGLLDAEYAPRTYWEDDEK